LQSDDQRLTDGEWRREEIMSRWYENTVFYHMYPLGMVGAEKINSASVESPGFSCLDRWIPHIKELGCGAVYIGPLFQ